MVPQLWAVLPIECIFLDADARAVEVSRHKPDRKAEHLELEALEPLFRRGRISRFA